MVNSSTSGAHAMALRLTGRFVLLPGGSPLIAAATAAAAEPSSLCQTLAAQVRQFAPATTDSAFTGRVMIAQPVESDRWGQREMAVNARLRQVLEAKGFLAETEPGSIMELDHLPGTPLYMGSVVAGTAECQTVAFATLSSDAVPRVLPEPAGYTGVCWNVQGSLARVLGRPAYMESGTVSSTSADAVMRVTPWTGHDWAAPCQLTVEFNYSLKLAQQFCSDAALCRAAGAIALDIARGYVIYSTMQQQMRPIDDDDVVPVFTEAAGITVGPEAQAVVNAGWQRLKREQQTDFPGIKPQYGMMTSVFPTFGHQAPNGGWDYSFSYVNFALFALMVDGRLYLGAVGHNGVGWREGANILFAVYAAPDAAHDDLVPLAGFLIERAPSGFKGTVVAEGGSALPPRP